MPRAFVIQIHSGYGPTHYDLMIVSGPALATWQLSGDPQALAAGQAAAARRLADHRRAYLTYEGPVSKGRGRVEILDSGDCEVVCEQEDHWEVRLKGRKFAGRYELRRSGDAWQLRRLPEP